MPTRKCLLCHGTEANFSWPKGSPQIQNKWTLFVESNFPEIEVKKSSAICYLHFRQEDFRNWDTYNIHKNDKQPTR